VGVTDEETQGRKGRPTLLLQGLSLLKSCVGCVWQEGRECK